MQSHRSELSPTPPLAPSPAPAAASVQALGLSDVLRVEFRPCQMAGLMDEVDERHGPLRETFERARDRWEAVSRGKGAKPRRGIPTEEVRLSNAAYSLRVLAAIRAQIPSAHSARAFAIIGPATTVSEIISAATRNAADDLADALRDRDASGASTDRYKVLRELTAIAQAWVETYIDCDAVEWYRFDPDWDPVEIVS
jgi:hypothetical protein